MHAEFKQKFRGRNNTGRTTMLPNDNYYKEIYSKIYTISMMREDCKNAIFISHNVSLQDKEFAASWQK